MKTLRRLIFNPIGIGLALVHWVVVIYALTGDIQEGFRQPTLLVFYLLILDSPATLISNLIVQIPGQLLGLSSSAYLYPAIWCTTITVQWLLIGGLIQWFIDSRGSEELSLTPVPGGNSSHHIEKSHRSF